MASSINTSNQVSQIGITPFMLAAGSNNASVDTLRHMVDSGAIPNEVSDEGGTALIHACVIRPNENQVAKARYIIEATATFREELKTSRFALEHLSKELLEIVYNYAWPWGADFVNVKGRTKERAVTTIAHYFNEKCRTKTKTVTALEAAATAFNLFNGLIVTTVAVAEWRGNTKIGAQTATSAAVSTALALRAALTHATAERLKLVPMNPLIKVLKSNATQRDDIAKKNLSRRLMGIIDGSGIAWKIEMLKLLLSSGAKLSQRIRLLKDDLLVYHNVIQVNPAVTQELEKAEKEQAAINKAASTKK